MIDITRPESRYARQELITWWDQARLRDSSVLVVGAGALGNELVKGLALAGVGNVTVIDLDTVERSNLSRCVFFREEDEGRPKAEVVASAAQGLNPESRFRGLISDVTRQGLGWMDTFDLVLAGLDNREARVWINQACRKLGIPWIDGAIEGLRGVARVFLPEGPCYECTLSETDREILNRRRSCALLSPEQMETGKVPTTATSAALVAAIQAQEAIRLLHGDRGLANQGWTFIGETLDAWVTQYSEDDFCLAHDRYAELRPTSVDGTTTLRELVDSTELDPPTEAIDLEADLVTTMRCSSCDLDEVRVNRRLVDLTYDDGTCDACGNVMAIDTTTSLTPDDPLLEISIQDLGLPDLDVVTLRNPSSRVHLCLHHS